MIKDKLKVLSEFINDIEKVKPIILLEKNINKIEEDVKDISQNQVKLASGFRKDISYIISTYKKRVGNNPILVFELYISLISLLRQSLIEEKADLLGIDRRLYKDDMRLLFKGKRT